jgi:hypothetical protein
MITLGTMPASADLTENFTEMSNRMRVRRSPFCIMWVCESLHDEHELDECAADPLEAAQPSLLYLESQKNRG